MSVGCLFEDRFIVRSVDSSKFESVSRIRGKSTGFDAEIVIDINTDLFHVTEKESLFIGITNTVSGGVKTVAHSISRRTGVNDWDSEDANNIINEYDYVMYGKIFNVEDKSSERRTLYASFGGLLMALTAVKQVLGDLELDMRIYLLIRRSEDIVA